MLVQVRNKNSCKPDDFACIARSLACEFADRILLEFGGYYRRDDGTMDSFYWQKVDNAYIFNSVYMELTTLCGSTKTIQKPSWNWLVNYPFKCGLDVEGYRKKNDAVNYQTMSLKMMAEKSFDFALAAAKGIPVVATFLGFFRVSFNMIWPSKEPEKNPCDDALKADWGKCVWQQILPFVDKFVNKKIEKELEKAANQFYQDEILGLKGQLASLKEAVDIASTTLPNGTVVVKPEAVEEMREGILNIVFDMIGKIPSFMHVGTTGYAYLGQFASLHTSLAANVFGTPKGQLPRYRIQIQQLLGCYTMAIFNRTSREAQGRVREVILGHFGGSCGGGLWCEDYEEFGCHDAYPDCPWDLSGEDGRNVACDPKHGGAHACDPYDGYARRKMECENRQNNTRDQTFWFWKYWMEPIPQWLNMMVEMQKVQRPGEHSDVKELLKYCREDLNFFV